MLVVPRLLFSFLRRLLLRTYFCVSLPDLLLFAVERVLNVFLVDYRLLVFFVLELGIVEVPKVVLDVVLAVVFDVVLAVVLFNCFEPQLLRLDRRGR